MEKITKVTVVVCDNCEKSRPLAECVYCGAKICEYCSARVIYTQTENVRGHCIGFFYNRLMCQKHLPKK